MTDHRTWRERFMAGEATVDDIVDEFDAWHDAPDEPDAWAWLGVTEEEYALYVRDVVVFEQEMLRKREESR